MTFLVVGLGNPGAEYAGNRHNIGYMVADELARRADATLSTHKATGARMAQIRLGVGPGGVPGPRVVLMLPGTYMNTSGGPVKAVASYFGIEARDIIVCHDDIDLQFGEVKLKRGGGEGGHNGLRDISRALGTRDYVRVRGGCGHPGRADVIDYVLGNFPAAQREEAALMIQLMADAVEMTVGEGLEAAQLKFHTKN